MTLRSEALDLATKISKRFSGWYFKGGEFRNNYAAFAWSVAEEAYEVLLQLARKHDVGFFDASGAEGRVVRPS